MEKRLDVLEDQIKILFNKYDDLASNVKVITTTSTQVSNKVNDMSIILEELNRYLKPDLSNNRPGVVMQTRYNQEDIKKQEIRVDGAFHRIDETKDRYRVLDTKVSSWNALVADLSKKVATLTHKLDKFKPINTLAVIGMITIATGLLGLLIKFGG